MNWLSGVYAVVLVNVHVLVVRRVCCGAGGRRQGRQCGSRLTIPHL